MLLGSANGFHQRYVRPLTSAIIEVGFDVCGGYFALMFLSQFFRPQRTQDCNNLLSKWKKPQQG
jgi:hypothetical protein